MATFTLTEENTTKISEWYREHSTVCTLVDNQGAIGGLHTYQFTPTSLGMVKKVVCACGAEIDVTEYEEW